ncbi:MAG: ABC transporter permease subunit [Rhodanobacteraceae bacterium]
MSALAVARLDLKRLLVRPFAWTFAAIALAVLAWTFLLDLNTFLVAQPKLVANVSGPGFTDLVAVPQLLAYVQLCVLLAPLVTMHALAGERRAHTLPLLLAAGLPPTRLVLGKFFSALLFLWVLLMVIALMPLALAHTTTPDWGQFAAALFGCALCVAALTAIGIACSAFASHPALAAAGALLIALILASLDIGARASGVGIGWLAYLSLPTHLTPLLHGIVASVDVVYFLLLIVVALALAVRRVAAEKVRG